MNRPSRPPLGVEPVEDRVLPSGPRPAPTFPVAYQASAPPDAARAPRDATASARGPFVGFGGTDRASQNVQADAGRRDTPAAARATAADMSPVTPLPAAPQQGARASDQSAAATPGPVGSQSPPPPPTPEPAAPQPANGIAQQANGEPPRPAASSPSFGSGVLVFLGAVATDAAREVALDLVARGALGTAVLETIVADPTPVAPIEMLGVAVTAALPALAPLADAIPVNVAAVEAAVADLLAHIPTPDPALGWGSPERWAWVAAAALAAGGATYAVRGRGKAATGKLIPASNSVLARWEDERERGTR